MQRAEFNPRVLLLPQKRGNNFVSFFKETLGNCYRETLKQINKLRQNIHFDGISPAYERQWKILPSLKVKFGLFQQFFIVIFKYMPV